MPHRYLKTIADIIREQHSRYDRLDNGTSEQPSFDTTVENDVEWDERYGTRDARCGAYNTRKSWNNI